MRTEVNVTGWRAWSNDCEQWKALGIGTYGLRGLELGKLKCVWEKAQYWVCYGSWIAGLDTMLNIFLIMIRDFA